MKKILPRLALLAAPFLVYFALFFAFEPSWAFRISARLWFIRAPVCSREQTSPKGEGQHARSR